MKLKCPTCGEKLELNPSDIKVSTIIPDGLEENILQEYERILSSHKIKEAAELAREINEAGKQLVEDFAERLGKVFDQ